MAGPKAAPQRAAFGLMNNVINVCFVVEVILKIFAYGLALEPGTSLGSYKLPPSRPWLQPRLRAKER